ncbi:cobalt-precorrin-6A reductase [Kushneria phosphatilytica]|uniref:Cobalt-precorrin-6A reductase n=1 Tax=Kushneria phosphatilytica TaxID=657387 RepID=A0A5C0ZV62_9GAMM|nr:cobalt-precorrin-6A reductase [Kushneria phosphatilytica]QEL09868.1 cobalt-precorrin-6A reductase [Kushneria phosphatilytica]
MPLRLLLLGGTGEARRLAERLAGDDRFEVILSLAGRTRTPRLAPVAIRQGGFGGIAGLITWLERESIDAMILATHPFAVQMAAHAEQAAKRTGTPTLHLARPEWPRHPQDCWLECDRLEDAPALLGDTPRRVLLALGRQQAALFEAAPQHDYLIRSVEPLEPALDLPRAQSLLARGPFTLASERELLKRHGIEVIVTKHSGGEETYAKIAAARELGIRVVMVRRPPAPALPRIERMDEALEWLTRQAGLSGSHPGANRGE